MVMSSGQGRRRPDWRRKTRPLWVTMVSRRFFRGHPADVLAKLADLSIVIDGLDEELLYPRGRSALAVNHFGFFARPALKLLSASAQPEQVGQCSHAV
jgi:hypothetical protein